MCYMDFGKAAYDFMILTMSEFLTAFSCPLQLGSGPLTEGVGV